MDKDGFSEGSVAVETEVVTNGAGGEDSCCSWERVSCCSPETESTVKESFRDVYKSGCAVCGLPLIYFWKNKESTCFFCGKVLQANAGCPNGHFVCDRCHSADGIEVIKIVCLNSGKTAMAELMQIIRSHPLFPIHGPEHHSLVPAVIMAALRNNGYTVSDEEIRAAIERGKTVGGGACAFLGVCGAAIGVGIAVSLLLKANPYDGAKRQAVQQVTQTVLGRIASYRAPRCCQRDSWLALEEAGAIIQKHTGKSPAVSSFNCDQHQQNKECIHGQCPLWPAHR